MTDGHEPTTPAPETDEESVLSRLEGRLDEVASTFGRTDWVELLAAIVLAFATVLAAWSAYQSSLWGGEQAKAANDASAARISMLGLLGVAETQGILDSQLAMAWIDAALADDEAAMAEYESRVREEAQPAWEAWLASAPPGGLPEGSPLDMPEYDEYAIEAVTLAQEAAEIANESTTRAGEANHNGDNFVLVAVVMAAVLFFAGIGSKFTSKRLRALMVVLSSLVLIAGIVFLFSLPQIAEF